ncbi:NAD-dependent epimerase/dehydratase family protein [Pseudochelatococcus sp. G4_1912]|uniref:NAD-dependent epimerase/dehydratase family protein n=1 Tax=Pseudochelatococcus sp. G4_1912 TaxID=3114288 RepID=UPI0039C67254
MRVLVTGEKGFTARYVSALLKSLGHETLPLAADLTSSQEVERRVSALAPDVVLHLAGISYVPQGTDAQVYAVNTVGTVTLLEALARLSKPPHRVVLASSAHVYGVQRGRLTEASPLAPVSHYGASKLAMEHLARPYRTRFEIVIARPFNYTGAGQARHFLVPKLVEAFRTCQPVLRLGNINVARDFSDVRRIAHAYLALLTNDHVPEVLNLCSGRAIAIEGMMEMLRAQTDCMPQLIIDPDLVRANEVDVQCGDPSLMEQLLGDVAMPFEETLRWMLSSPIEKSLMAAESP